MKPLWSWEIGENFRIIKTRQNPIGVIMDKIIEQNHLIKEGDWDCLIILDACRYDYFEKIYKDYLEGDLKKVLSPGSFTLEWFEKTFEDDGFKNVSYVSGNPFINSKTSVGPDKLTEKFKKIIDVWDSGWNEKLNTVPPAEMLEAGRHIKGRKILHLLQPHGPYMSEDSDVSPTSQFPFKLHPKLNHILTNIGKHFNSPIWKGLFWLSNKLSTRKNSLSRIVRGYKTDLRIALKKISDYRDQMDEKVVVTSDHGESFGENGIFGHPPGQTIPVLREVPWLELK